MICRTKWCCSVAEKKVLSHSCMWLSCKSAIVKKRRAERRWAAQIKHKLKRPCDVDTDDPSLHLPWLRCRRCTWPRADAAFRPGWWATGILGSWWQAHRRRRGWRWLCKEEVVRLWEEEGKAHNTHGQLLIACIHETSWTNLDFCVQWERKSCFVNRYYHSMEGCFTRTIFNVWECLNASFTFGK